MDNVIDFNKQKEKLKSKPSQYELADIISEYITAKFNLFFTTTLLSEDDYKFLSDTSLDNTNIIEVLINDCFSSFINSLDDNNRFDLKTAAFTNYLDVFINNCINDILNIGLREKYKLHLKGDR